MKHHIVSVKTYIGVFLALMVLTALTVAVAFKNFGFMNDVIALTIAVIKMMFVVMIFMHLKYSLKLLWLVAGAGILWLIIMFSLTLTDYRTREWLEQPKPWVEQPVAEHHAESVPEAGSHH
jgi:cytochrome c oxidase subunit 4